VVLNWHLNRGYSVLAKTVTESRLGENMDSFDFKLSPEEHKKIDALDQGARLLDPLYY